MSEERDPIIDACLDEELGGVKPPDLTKRILQALAQEPTSADSGIRVVKVVPRRQRVRKPVEPPVWTSKPMVATGIALSLGVALLIGAVATWQGVSEPRKNSKSIARSTGKKVTKKSAKRPSKAPVRLPAEGGVVDEQPADPPMTTPPLIASGPQPESSNLANAGSATSSPQIETPVDSNSGIVRRTDGEVVGRVNSLIAASWTTRSVTAAPPVSEAEWCKRAFQLVIGREPKPDESEAFLQGNPQSRKSELLDRLIESPEYANEFAKRWGDYWTEVLLDADTLSSGHLAIRDGLSQYMQRAILDRRPFDQIARELLTATGTGAPGSGDYNGAANFLLARAGHKSEQATSDVARLFLGRNIDCQRCHDDPRFDGGNQEQYWQFNAFFRQLAIQGRKEGQPPVLADVDFAGDDKNAEDAKVFYVDGGGLLKVAYPILDGKAIATNGLVAAVNRRRELANLIVASPEYSRNLANRTWAAMVGQGFVPLERSARNNTLAYPEALIELGDQFAAHGFDFRKLVHWAALSEPFQREAIPAPQLVASVESEPVLFNGFYGTPPKRVTRVHEILAARAKVFGTPADPTTAKVEALPPTKDAGKDLRLTPTDSAASMASLDVVEDSMFKTVVGDTKLTNQQKVEHLFQMALHRQPHQHERALADEMISKAGANSAAALRAIWISLNAARE